MYYLEQDSVELKKKGGGVLQNFMQKASNIEQTLQGKKTQVLVQCNRQQTIPIYLKDKIQEAMKAYKENECNESKLC
ncbi:hypothetical protein XJ32_00520 [Helicobacter bilis]|uniref:Uncharacterized protein n=1 Tax=Helicobacter bilis TaxID=37372 RepID=A0A1Q2LEF4_9HELI|nr:hypothetical protein [Helicobacter bilis]AQQ58826.1 hypothetical protein XJ32_00520 [Helicobacter bilis]